ncbi:TetR/AcrR family transcriptional regulator [Microlunatus parietis]|uniref:AcrR family transcriptional regulator n=1 Tax=Microlunatus parietis TaxID=682979 RepID=A0A7Y9LAU2_9ACTN|nr:TetR family transcriptional regulator [Microlunatus parietis]NYE71042.1 AcrR family transcriptional regulator [Microlunatus parietis]
MSSVETKGDDLTARARIRNVAIAHFARDGFTRAKVRSIAAEAGVSVGLIFHHFGSKDGLRAACDAYVLATVSDRARAAARPSGAGLPELLDAYLADPEAYRRQALYLARAIEEDVPAAGPLVEALVAEAEAIFRAGAEDGSFRHTDDPRALAVLTLIISQGILTMPAALVRALGAEDFGPEALRRLTGPALELFTRGVYVDDSVTRSATDAWIRSMARPPNPGKD